MAAEAGSVAPGPQDGPVAATPRPLAPPGRDFDEHKDEIAQLGEISRNAQTTFLTLMAACIYSLLTIANTTDAALLANSDGAPLPIIQVNVPTGGFFALAPLMLALLFVYFHLYLERYWRCLEKLPLHHKDGRGLDDYIYPWLISCAFIRGEIRPLAGQHRGAARVQAWLSRLLGWWLVPLVLLCYWARYLVVHDWPVTLLHIMLLCLSVGVAMHFVTSTRNVLRRMEAAAVVGPPAPEPGPSRQHALALVLVPGAAAAVLLYLSWVAFERLVGPACDVPSPPPACRFDGAGRALWSALDRKPFVEVEATRFVPRPTDWDSLLKDRVRLKSYLDSQRTLALRRRDLRGLIAKESFLPGSVLEKVRLDQAQLESAVLTHSRLAQVQLDGSNLRAAKFAFADITDSALRDVQASFANFNEVAITRGQRSTELSGDFSEARFAGARAAGVQFGRRGDAGAELPLTSLRDAVLVSAGFSEARFDNVDMTGAKLMEVDFRAATFDNVEFTASNLSGSDLTGATFTRCRFLGRLTLDKSAFADAKFIGARFNATGGADDDDLEAQRKDLSAFSARGARFDATTRFVNLRVVGADLLSASFDGTVLRQVRFVDTDLADARFEHGVDLSQVEFERVVLSGADLRAARGVSARLLAGACADSPPRLPADLKHLELKPCH